ncbi:MFS transporter [Paraburkholderia sp. BL23I1N1]|uniref:MFS transporter n=1 Tax=Paraburkholderia sp. BL23I1N1 TaxID=1938802 RepID=UPI000E72BABF|nr:MFS transporter [Paraburkholderia sp. BL23I1N1]
MRPARAMPFVVLGLFGLYTLEFGVIGILPALIESFHVTVARAGQLTGLFALTVAIFGPALVLFSSRLSRKKVLVVSLAVFAGCSLLSALVHVFNWILALRMFAALFHPMFYAAALETATSLYPPEQTGHAVSRAVIGTTLGLVVGVPMMSGIASATNYQNAFLFCAAVCAVAGLGLLVMLPPTPKVTPPGYGEQLSILRKPALWMNIAAVVLIFTALFSVYGYAAEYLKHQVGLSDPHVSLALLILGIGGVSANLLIGKLLDSHLVKVVLLQPLALGTIYLILFGLARNWMPAMAPIALMWGGIHACGLVASQMWLRSVSRDAHSFATSLYLTAANLGVVGGSFAGGVAIRHLGMPGAIGCGIAFAALALAAMLLKLAIYGVYSSRAEFLAARNTKASSGYLSQQEQFR